MKLLFLKIKLWIKRHRKIKDLKGFELQNKPSGYRGIVTRQMKRNAVIKMGDKTIKILDYIEKRCPELPSMLTIDNEKVDHKGCMNMMYMQYGIKGITMYENHVKKWWYRTAQKEVKKNLKQSMQKYGKDNVK